MARARKDVDKHEDVGPDKSAAPAANAAGGYQVVARRFRPTTFQELVGQDEVLQSLRLALRQKTVPHAFLFSGSRGVGKTTSARILARCLNCEQGPTPEPCGTCAQCTSILDGSNPDVIEIDAASNNSVDDVRNLREHVAYATMLSRYRVVILDEAHMLSKGAFNALLKTLEEPPPRVVFVLATTELHKLPDTIRSRCQVLLFRRVAEPDLHKRLHMIADQEQVAVPDDVLAEIVSAVRGGVRDAETALERLLPVARELGKAFDLAAYRTLVARVGIDATIGVVESLLAGDAKAGLHFVQELQQRGTDEREALGEIVEVLRWLLLLRVDGADSVLVPISGKLRERLQALAKGVEATRLDAMIAAGLRGRQRLRDVDDRAVVFEVTMVRMAQAGALPTVADLLAEVRAGGGAPASAPVRFGSGARPPATVSGSMAPGAATQAPRPATAAEPLPTDLRGRTLALLKASNHQLLFTTIELCRFEGPSPTGTVVVTLHSDRRLYADRLQARDVQTELAKVIGEAAGREVRVDWRLPGLAAEGQAASPANPPPKIEPGPLTKRVMGAVRGRIVQVNPEDRLRPEPAPESRETEPAAETPPVEEPPPNLQE
ncbi:MAG: DNA polymerase III subunit gamma/tau [Planctomycetota bacterium]